MQDPFEQVFVAVFDVTPEDERALDGWEAVDTGLYRKTKVRVSTMTGELVVWTYVLDAYEGGLPVRVLPRRPGRRRRGGRSAGRLRLGPAPPGVPLHRPVRTSRAGDTLRA